MLEAEESLWRLRINGIKMSEVNILAAWAAYMYNILLKTSDTPSLRFKVRTVAITYGDDRTFREYRLLIYRGPKLVGYEEGPRRETATVSDCLRAARTRIQILKSHRLYAIKVTRKHISDGVGRDCRTCAISQALWHNQERMGFPKREYSFEVSPYAAFVEADGIRLRPEYGQEEEFHIPPEAMPDLVNGRRGKYIFNESMEEWAMRFDEWADSRYTSLTDWREEHGYDDGERPYRPGPSSFVLDLDAFVPMVD